MHPDGGQWAGRDAANPGLVHVWDLRTGARLATLHGHAGEVFAIRFRPDGSRLATAGRDQTIRLWDTDYYEQLVPLHGHAGYVWSLAWSRDGGRLASGSGDHTVRIGSAGPAASPLR